MIIGVTGGIGSGKSTVTGMLGELGAIVIDADAIAREIVEPGSPGLLALVEAFGPGILRDDGTLNRGKLAELAFGDPPATRKLNEIMHPRISVEAQRRIEQAPSGVVVYDMPLLFETGQQTLVDHVVVVDVPEDIQIRRAVELRGLARDDVERRMQVQLSRADRLAAADTVIDNSGQLSDTRTRVEEFWRSVVS
jgi:dephospho-CoA kinase